MKDFRTLAVWEKAHHFTLAIYRLSKTFPKEELFGLTSQIRRAAASIPTNIAEGCGRSTDPDFARFLQIAFGSACEVESDLSSGPQLPKIGRLGSGISRSNGNQENTVGTDRKDPG
jgi:four helix bundle protein